MSDAAEEAEVLPPERTKFRYKKRSPSDKIDPRNNPHVYQKVFDCARLRLTQAEAATLFQVHTTTFEKWLQRDPDARDAWDAGREMQGVSLKRMLWVHAMSDPPTARYLANNLLDYSNDPKKNKAITDAGPGNRAPISREEALARIQELQTSYKDITPKPKALAQKRERQQ